MKATSESVLTPLWRVKESHEEGRTASGRVRMSPWADRYYGRQEKSARQAFTDLEIEAQGNGGRYSCLVLAQLGRDMEFKLWCGDTLRLHVHWNR